MADPKLVELARLVAEQEQLRANQQRLMAQMIRECVRLLTAPDTYGLRGHETAAERGRRIAKNRKQKKLVPLYLEALATQLEDAAEKDVKAWREANPDLTQQVEVSQ